MKRTRKGFTLVELLIVVAILATLTATMMVSMRGATAKAKAASIAANLDSCRTAAMLYYAANGHTKISKHANEMLKENLKTWEDLKGRETDSIVYTAVGTDPKYWAVNVDFSNDSEADKIADALKNMRGYPSDLTAFAGSYNFEFDFFGATPAYAVDANPEVNPEVNPEDESQNNETSSGGGDGGKLYMNLLTGKISKGAAIGGEGDNVGDGEATPSTTTQN